MLAERNQSSGFSRAFFLVWLGAIAVAVVLFALNLLRGEINQDEGWYLYAARLISQGKLPYIDFASTQGPVLPFVYVLVQPLVNHWGLVAGRLFTAFLGLLCSFAAAWLAARLASPGKRHFAALTAFCLVGMNVYQSYFFTIVKTYSLAGLLITMGFVLLSFTHSGRGSIAVFFSGVLIVLAAGTRISAGIVLPIIFIWLLVVSVKYSRSVALQGLQFEAHQLRYAWLWFGIGGAVSCCVVFVPFLVKAPEALGFALFDYHAGRDTGGLIQILAYKAGFVSRIVQAYFVAVAIGVAVLLNALVAKWKTDDRNQQLKEGWGTRGVLVPALLPLWLSALGVTLLHFLAPFPYDDYQAMIFPVFAAALAVAVSRAMASERMELWTLLTIVLLCAASSFSSPINEKWFVGERDKIWWPIQKKSSLTVLRETGQRLRWLSKPGDVLLTQDPYLAVESGLNLPEGLELGPFSYFPDWSTEKAAKCHVLNKEMMMKLLETSDAQVAAFSGYGFAIKCPSITKLPSEEQAELWETVLDRYGLFREIPNFGQAGTKLSIYLRK